MNKIPQEHECAHILIVEGYSDLLFYCAFLQHMKKLKGVYIHQLKGQSNIRSAETLSLYLTKLALEEKLSIAILLDADNEPQGTALAMKNRLREITGREVVEGQWHEKDGQARLGFFVVPDTQTNGEIETLTWNAFPADEKHLAMKAAVLDFHEKMKDLGWESHSPDKGRISAYLAAAYDEDPRLGPGARERKFSFDSPGFDRLRAFFEVLPTDV